ncbi:ATP-binding protein [Nocardioides albus]|uniref:DNA-binding CsgD family transcriptional regulator n=1 Tax=Nocardioides albus TaxID=1841 RepID=A0A7W5A1D5_9ACTN|nr:AAA family ATPase [Nocardioides albus]MBB3087856.1 DNA-binding CsgD family transcriptional regulator [Nocardioides albus]GGU20789.1 LuxR family transcriptional regulator [Nocardioides albus]
MRDPEHDLSQTGAVRGDERASPPAANPRRGQPNRLSSATLVGRERELSDLVAGLATTPAVAVIEGDSGIGKTRLIDELRTHPAYAGRRFAVGRCRSIGEPFPLGPVVESLRRHGEALQIAALSPVAGAVRPLLPELSSVLPPLPPGLDDHVAERHRVFRGLVEVIEALGEMVLVLEDLHWADEQTVEFIDYLVSDPPPRLGLVLTYRGAEVAPPTRTVLGRVPAEVGQVQIGLSSLTPPQTRLLASAILDTDTLSEEFATYLWERTAGLPFAIEELLALLQARGSLAQHGSQWIRRALDELDVPDRIRDTVLERAGRLSPAARTVAEAAAVLQTAQPPHVLQASADCGGDVLLDALEEALRSGLLFEDGANLGFRHPLAAQAVYDAIPGPRRRQIHSRAAAALQELGDPAIGQIAHHLRETGRSAAWAEAAERAADQAMTLRNDGQAVRLLADVLREADLDAEIRARLAVKLGQAAVEAIHAAPDVTGLLASVLEEPLPAPARGELRLSLSVLLSQVGGDPVLRRQLYADAVDDLGHRPDLQAWAMVGLGIPTVPGVEPAELLHWLHRSLEIVPRIEDPVSRVFMWGKAAMVLVALGDPAWRHLVDRMEEQTGGSPQRRGEVNAYDSVGLEACYSGHHVVAERLLSAGLRGAAACESHRLELRVRRSVALLDYSRGRWEGLDEQVRVLVDELDGYASGRLVVEAVAGALALARGDLDTAMAGLTAVVRRAEELNDLDVLPVPAAALIRLQVARGEVTEAAGVGEDVLRGAESMGIWVPALRAVPPYVEALCTAGRVDEARAMMARVTAAVEGLEGLLAPAVFAHSGGHLAAAAADWADAARLFSAAADHYRRFDFPYEAAQAAEQAACCHHELGDAAAKDLMSTALAAYESLGAEWDMSRASRLGRRIGVPVPGRHRGGRYGYGSQLSPRERQVAELAAAGLTDQQIARELHLSVKTVEKHVSAAKRKLETPTRVALAVRLSEVEPPA